MTDLHTPDLCVIGAGAGGLAAAEAACELGASVVLVERDRLGGSLLNVGALPAQALAAAAAHAHAMRLGPAFGIAAEAPKPNFRRVHDHVDQVIRQVSPHHSIARYEALGATIIRGEARFVDRQTVSVGDSMIKARRFVVATGSRPVVPAIPGLESVPYFTPDTIVDNTRKLTHLLIIGGSPAGMELAQAHVRLGSQVTVVEPATPLAGFDPELAAIVLRSLEDEGVAIRGGTTVSAIQARSMGTGVVIRSGEAEAMLDVSHILVAPGRVPALDGLDLGKAGIRFRADDPARLQLSRGLRTSNPRVFAIGDAAGAAHSVQSSVQQGRRVARSAVLGLAAMGPQVPPAALVLTDPGLAEIGLTEAVARRKHGNSVLVLRAPYAENDLARAQRTASGLAKLLVTRSGKIVGAGVVGSGAGELAAFFGLAMAHGIGARQLAGFVAPYPTLAEIATRLGAAYVRETAKEPLLQHWVTFNRLLP